jgi:hypothetical protein
VTGYIVEQKLRNGEYRYRYRDGGAGLGMRSILSHWVAVDAATSTSLQPNSLEVVGEVLQHRQQRFRFARHLYFPNDLACASTMQMLVSLTETSSPAKWSMLRFSF